MSSVSAPAAVRRADRHCESWSGLLYTGTITDTRIATSPLQTGLAGDAWGVSLAGRIRGCAETSSLLGATDFPEDCVGASSDHLPAEGLRELMAGFTVISRGITVIIKSRPCQSVSRLPTAGNTPRNKPAACNKPIHMVSTYGTRHGTMRIRCCALTAVGMIPSGQGILPSRERQPQLPNRDASFRSRDTPSAPVWRPVEIGYFAGFTCTVYWRGCDFAYFGTPLRNAGRGGAPSSEVV